MPIRYITDLGFTDDKTYKNDNAAKSGEVNSNGDHHPTNYDDISLDESMGLGHNHVDIIAYQCKIFSGERFRSSSSNEDNADSAAPPQK